MAAKKARRQKSGLEADDNPGRSVPLSFDLRCSDVLGPLVQCFRERAIALDKKRPRPSSVAKLEDSFDLLLSNIINAYRISPRCFVGVSLSRNDYTKTRYRKRDIGYDNLIRAFDYLVKSTPPLLSYVNGWNDPRTRIGRNSRIKATGYLRALLRRYVLFSRHVVDGRNINGLFDKLYNDKIDHKVDIPAEWVASIAPVEIIRLKNEHRKLTDYEETNDTKAMRGRLDDWNTFLSEHHHVDLLKTDAEIENLFRVGDFDEENDAAAFFGDEPDRPQFVQFERVRLHRVFNNSSFKEGGRFYGAWWQRIPSDARRYITINDKPTKEFDYSNLHAAMLYAREGLPLLEDAYTLEGVDQKYRKLIKSTFFRLINAKLGQRVQRPRETALPHRWSWKELQEAISERHAPIARYLRSGEGLRLQKIDADIAEDVMHAMKKKDYLVLPVHDSFIAAYGWNLIQNEMRRAYRKYMKNEIGIKPDLSFLEFELEKSPANEGDEIPGILDEVEWRSEDDGYEGYRARRNAFLKSRTDEWNLRFGPGRNFLGPKNGVITT